MPSISVSKNALLAGIEKTYTDEKTEEALFEFGLELDEIYTEEGEVKYKIDIPANRYDLLCLRGLVHGLKAYIDNAPGKSLCVKTVDEKVLGDRPEGRPYIKVAVMKGIDLENGGYSDLINFQDKLHQGLGLNRTLMAIGTHDYDKTQRPYRYVGEDEDLVKFQPLSQDREYTRKELDTLYEKDGKLKEYLKLGRENGKVPVLYDATGRVLSLPPLINSDFSKITEKTKNILVEVTGTDLGRVSTAMHLILHHFAETTTEIEELTPDSPEEKSPFTVEVTPETVKKELLIDLSLETVKTYLERMMHTVEVLEGSGAWRVRVTPSKLRTDVLHLCDIVEDIAIAHGYNNFKKTLGNTYTVGQELPVNRAADALRRECAMVEYTELFTMALMSREDYYGFGVERHIAVKNPKSTECAILRQHLIPSVLKCLIANQHYQLPLKVFELSDVGEFAESDVGVRNSKRLCMGICGRSSGLESLQESFDVVMKRQGYAVTYEEEDAAPFIPGRSCRVLHKGKKIGVMGVMDLSILNYHKMPFICSFVEVSVDELVNP
ncbi:phenylalanyl-tRNA synthetase beta chain [Nematocida major]|uniref:phenylalanyl-tRNA synthetase beta chain n=1 Tax=Nematocida major TaxID=1912982 RepID=UPI002008C378|nr:phenylalanyl-tRNA synthetase beta chain [Nematocida major]KAH9385742.1 phenylalanyl-tRNA synthetase beta chain [Nematocida major]